MSGFTYREVNGDLFSCRSDYSMCHCVAADMRMGKGIAVKFRYDNTGLYELMIV